MPKSKEKELNKKVTHRDFQEYLVIASEVFATKADLKNLATKPELLKIKDEILNSNDKLAGKLDKILTEQTMQTSSYSRQDKEIVKIKDRVDRVEKHLNLKSVSS
ncbi:MAG: hypothetical protein HYT38_02235 [Candidatus Sungbacteria bacterium]|uniref:Uncharacterized protein n=1 Tax=Candidatus Sungiibacteriota bacterium TaxID=2750080 RepID=A0A9D6HQP9_9BACT|nr:hypothetical protein [Candidatus Sungbacteria bacterium]